MKNYFLLFVIILTVLVACNPNDDDTLPPNPPNPTNLPSWSSVGEIYGIGGSVIRCSEVYNGELYVGGSFDAIDGVVAKNIAKWNGTNWTAVNGCSSIEVNSYQPAGMEVYNGELYVTFRNAIAHYPQKWNGYSWSNVDSSFYTNTIFGGGVQYPYKNNMIVFNGLLINRNKSFNGTVATDLVQVPQNDTFCDLSHSHCILNNKLYCSGRFYDPNNVSSLYYGISKWDNNEWYNIAGQTIGNNTFLYDMVTFNNEMYVSGVFTSLGGQVINNLAKYDGSAWYPISGVTSSLECNLYVDNSQLYLSPAWNLSSSFNFDTSNNPDSAFRNVVRYNGSNWEYVTDSSRTKTVFGPVIMYNSYLYAFEYLEDAPFDHQYRIVRVQPQ